MTEPIDTADTVLHRPSGEAWVVAFVENDRLCACGWPCSLVPVADCTLIEKATAKKRADLLKEMAAMDGNDPRKSYAVRALSTPSPAPIEAWIEEAMRLHDIAAEARRELVKGGNVPTVEADRSRATRRQLRVFLATPQSGQDTKAPTDGAVAQETCPVAVIEAMANYGDARADSLDPIECGRRLAEAIIAVRRALASRSREGEAVPLTEDDAAAHMFPSDLEKFKSGEHTATAFSIKVGNPDETSVALFTLEQLRAAAPSPTGSAES